MRKYSLGSRVIVFGLLLSGFVLLQAASTGFYAGAAVTYLNVQITPSGTGWTVPGGSGVLIYGYGSNVAIKATPVSGWRFDHWVKDGVNVGATNPLNVLMTSSHTLTAVFTRITYTLTAQATPSGSGWTVPGGGVQTYNYGSNVAVTATPATGWRFDHWVKDGVNAGTSTTIYITMTSRHSLNAVFVSTSTSSPQQPPIGSGLPQLHTAGPSILDSSNRVVQLRGVDNPNFLVDATGYFGSMGVWDAAKAQADAANLKARGFNLVRILINMDWYDQNLRNTWNGANTATRGARDSLNDYISYCNQNGVYVLVVPWQVRGMPGQSGQTSYPWGVSPYLTSADYVSWSSRVAGYLAPYPNVLLELFNEPHGDEATWFAAAQQAITAIRARSQAPIVVQFGYCGGFDWVSRRALTGGSIIYSQHIYRTPLGSTMLSNMGIIDKASIRSYLVSQWRYDLVAGVKPMLIGEIGAWDSSLSELTWFRNTLSVLNEWGAGYAGWQWDAPTNGYPLQNPDRSLNAAGQVLVNAILYKN